jgi:pyruvate formate lyase activating enzyme
MDSTTHENLTGVPNGIILSNLKKVARMSKPLIIRVPVIPGLNDDPKHFDKMGGFLREVKTVDTVELLPYHNLGAPKYATLGREYSLGQLESPKPEKLVILKGLLEAQGLCVVIEGVE